MINIEKKEKIDVVTFSVNKIDALNADEIRKGIDKLFEVPNSKVIIDLSGIDYIDSSGFGCFLSIMRTGRNNYGLLKFSNPQPRVMELFETLHLHKVFQIYHDIDSCLRSFN
jgi:anti-sigma B factor antagonist